MNNLWEWNEAKTEIKNAIENDWNPHFELLKTEDAADEPILTLFILGDTTKEWELYQNAPEEVLEDFADYMEDAKEELLEKVGFDIDHYTGQEMTERLAFEMSNALKDDIRSYESRDGRQAAKLFYNMLMYSEWIMLPMDILEMRYEEEMKSDIIQ